MFKVPFTLIFLISLSLYSDSNTFLFKEDYDSISPISFYQCYRQSGLSNVGLALYSSVIGQRASSYVSDIMNARNGGLEVEVLFFPCIGVDIEKQIQFIKKNLGPSTISRFWVFPFFPYIQSYPQCDFDNYSPEQNCKFLENLVNLMKNNKLNAGIASYRTQWNDLFKQIGGCLQLKKSNLWWLIDDGEELDDEPNFNRFIKFGGWDQPYMKNQKSSSLICGQQFYKNYYQ